MSDAPAIRPHSPRQNRWAMTGLALLAAGSFGNAVIQKSGAAIFAAPPAVSESAAEPIAQATPAPPTLQMATAEPQPAPRPKAPSVAEPQPVREVGDPVVVAAEPVSPPAADASATVPSPEAPAPPAEQPAQAQ